MEDTIAKLRNRMIAKLHSRIEELEDALRPFADIEPSTFYAATGDENEAYTVHLADPYLGMGDFYGKDLARAREALRNGKETNETI